jgi:hypothetical protein
LRFTPEGTAPTGRTAARVYLNASGFAHRPVLDLAFRETGSKWTTTRYVQGDLSEAWTTIDVREVVQPTPAYDPSSTT